MTRIPVRDAVVPVAVALVAIVLLIARRPEAVVSAEFNWEEANAFYVPTYFLDPLSFISEPWGGTFQLIPRLGYLALRAVPVIWAPLAENLIAFVALALLAAFIASDRLSSILPDWRARVMLAALVILLPAQRDVIGAFMNSQWYGGVWLALVPFLPAPHTVAGRWVERAVAVAVSLTGPFSVFLAPVYLLRLRGDRSRHAVWLATIVAAGGVVQLASILTSGRADPTSETPLLASITTLWLHGTIVPLLGERLSTILVDVGAPRPLLVVGGLIIVVSLAIVAWRTLPHRAWPLAYAAVLVGLSGIAVHELPGVWRPGYYERYFVIASVLTVLVVLIGLVKRHALAAALTVILVAGIVTDFRLEPYPSQGWPEHHSCIGSDEPCVIPIWPHDFDVRWPGNRGDYVMPGHYDP